jgi:hypothetical protein
MPPQSDVNNLFLARPDKIFAKSVSGNLSTIDIIGNKNFDSENPVLGGVGVGKNLISDNV